MPSLELWLLIFRLGESLFWKCLTKIGTCVALICYPYTYLSVKLKLYLFCKYDYDCGLLNLEKHCIKEENDITFKHCLLQPNK